MQNGNSYDNGVFSVIKGVGLALALSFLGAVIFASILLNNTASDKIIYPVNQIIKAVSVLIGAFAFIRGEKGWLKGGAVGLLFTALSYLAFSAVGGDFSLSWLLPLELLGTALIGALSGSLAVNLRRY